MSQENNNQRWNRETAKRVFAGEYKLVEEFYKEDEENDKAPNYALLPSGEKSNRVLIMGTLTDMDEVGDNFWSMRVFDGTDEFIVSAGQYQPNALRQLRDLDVPEYVSVVAKTSSFEGDEGEVISTLTAEHITKIDEETRNTWVKETADQTMTRLTQEPNPEKKKADNYYDDESREKVKQSVVEALESLQS